VHGPVSTRNKDKKGKNDFNPSAKDLNPEPVSVAADMKDSLLSFAG